jgi:hypothetical protein
LSITTCRLQPWPAAMCSRNEACNMLVTARSRIFRLSRQVVCARGPTVRFEFITDELEVHTMNKGCYVTCRPSRLDRHKCLLGFVPHDDVSHDVQPWFIPTMIMLPPWFMWATQYMLYDQYLDCGIAVLWHFLSVLKRIRPCCLYFVFRVLDAPLLTQLSFFPHRHHCCYCCCCCACLQIMYRNLTVEENLTYSARFRSATNNKLATCPCIIGGM